MSAVVLVPDTETGDLFGGPSVAPLEAVAAQINQAHADAQAYASNAAKRSEIFGNKKPGIAPGILNFECSRQALPGPGCELFTHHRPVHEQCIFLK